MFRIGPLESLHDKEGGFTLVEVLVVILIIGILAAVAIPVFLNQRKVANDAAVESDVKNAMAVVESYFGENPNATSVSLTYLQTKGTKSTGTTLSFRGNANDYCIWGQHSNGKRYNAGDTWEQAGGRPYFLMSNKAGGYVNGTAVSSLSCTNAGTGTVWSST